DAGGVDAGTPDGGALDAGGFDPTTCTPSGWCWDLPRPVGANWIAVQAISDTEAWVFGEGGLVYHYDQGEWTLMETGQPFDLYVALAIAPNDIWAVGEYGRGAHWNGSTWTPIIASPDGQSLGALWGANSSHIWAGGGPNRFFNPGSLADIDFFDGCSWRFTF